MKINKSFGAALRQTRESKGITQEQLASKANLDRTFISLLERGKRQPSLRTIFELAKALDCHASTLVERTEKLL